MITELNIENFLKKDRVIFNFIENFRKLKIREEENLFLGGGALRDICLGINSIKDFDFFFEGEQSRVANIINEKIDLKYVKSAKDYVLRFDYTCNTLLYDIKNKKIIDPTNRAITAIEKRELEPVYYCSLLTNPKGILRGFRFIIEKNMSLTKEYENYLLNLSSLMQINNFKDNSKAIFELLKLFSNTESGIAINNPCFLKTLENLIPELSVVLYKYKIQLSSFLNFLDISFLNLKKEQKEFILNPIFESINLLGITKLSIFMFFIGKSFYDLDESKIRLNFEKLNSNIITNLISRYQYDKNLVKIFNEACKIMLSYKKTNYDKKLDEELNSSLLFYKCFLDFKKDNQEFIKN